MTASRMTAKAWPNTGETAGRPISSSFWVRQASRAAFPEAFSRKREPVEPCTIPTFSGKKLGTRIPREWVLPVFVAAVVLVLLLAFNPWETLTAITVGYLATIPLGVVYYRRQAKAYEAAQKLPDVKSE